MSSANIEHYMIQKYGTQPADWKITHVTTLSTGTEIYQVLNRVLRYKIDVSEDINGHIVEMSFQHKPVGSALNALDILNLYYRKGQIIPIAQAQAHPNILKYFRFGFYDENYEDEIALACKNQNIHQCVTGMNIWIGPVEPYDDCVDYHSFGILRGFLPPYILEMSENNYSVENALCSTQAEMLAEGIPSHTVQDVIKDLEARGFIYDPDICQFKELYPYL